MTVLRAALLAAAAALAVSAAPAFYMPLDTGNEWNYRDNSTGQTFQIRVGLGFVHSGNVYYKVSGYASGRLFVRNGEDGNLYYFDEENDQEFLLTSFESVHRGWYDTMVGGCWQGYQPQTKTVEYRGPHSYFANALETLYRSYSCADTGVLHELYVANVGLVERTISTIAGPRTFQLVHARVGPLVFAGEPNTFFRISLDRNRVERRAGESATLCAAIRVSVHHTPGITLRFASPQRFDIQLRNAAGEVVWRRSDGVVYPPVIEEATVFGELAFVDSIPVASLVDGQYTVEAWLNTVGREFAAATTFEVLPES